MAKSFRENEIETRDAVTDLSWAIRALGLPDSTACPACDCITLPVTVYCTGGYTGEFRYALANGLSNGCTPVSRGTIDDTEGSITVYGAAFSANEHYSSIEAQAVDHAGQLVFSGNARVNPSLPWNAGNVQTVPAEITVSYDDCVAWIEAGRNFAGGGIWCDNAMGETPANLEGFTEEQLAEIQANITKVRSAFAAFLEQYEQRRKWRVH